MNAQVVERSLLWHLFGLIDRVTDSGRDARTSKQRQTINRPLIGNGLVKRNLNSSLKLKRMNHQERWHSVSSWKSPTPTTHHST